uniref:G_PROTEIN_RECEP_F1_2 domain-containing protein n=1 Tax=Caenorhabditis tropicalis TaxID=1561998 RepID=A0A1I7UJA1_9PELO
MSITVYDNATYLFPDSGDSARFVLFAVFKWAQKIGYNSVQFEFYIAFLGVLLTTFHISILLRKSMMTSSVITIMTGVAVFDMTSMIITIGTNHMLYGTEGSEWLVTQTLWLSGSPTMRFCCSTPPATLLSFKLFWFSIAIRDLVRRSSTWLGVLMAFIRYTGLKFAMKPIFRKLAKPIFGVYAILISVIPSLILSIFYWLRYEFVESSQIWTPGEGCTLSGTRPIVSQKPSKLFTENDGIVGKVFMLINGLISKIIPCVLLPCLTVLLAIELRNAKSLRDRLNGQDKDKSTERTTALVIFMALSFFIAELPIGTALALQVAYTDIGFLFLATFVTHTCNAMFTINSITHCLVFFIMSSQYRKTVRVVCRISKASSDGRTIFTTSRKSF